MKLSGQIGVLIDLLRGADVGVTQDELGIAGRHASVLEQRRCRVAKVVQGDAWQPSGLTNAVESSQQVASFDGIAKTGLEDQRVFLAIVWSKHFQRSCHHREQGQIAPPSAGLDRTQMHRSVEVVANAGIGHPEVWAELFEGRSCLVALDDCSELLVGEYLLRTGLDASPDEVGVHGAFVDAVAAGKLSQAGTGLVAGDQLGDIPLVKTTLRSVEFQLDGWLLLDRDAGLYYCCRRRPHWIGEQRWNGNLKCPLHQGRKA